MLIKIYFRYFRETFSFYNKKLKIGLIFLIILCPIIAYTNSSSDSDFIVSIAVISFLILIYIIIGFHTMIIRKEYKYFEENGIKCNGRIINMISQNCGRVRQSDDDTYYYYLLVGYVHPTTNKFEQFKTERINGNPYTYLSSLDVTVYVLPDGRALATDFKRIKHLKDSIAYSQNKKLP